MLVVYIGLLHGLITRVTDFSKITCTTVNSYVLTSALALVWIKGVCKMFEEFSAITCCDLSRFDSAHVKLCCVIASSRDSHSKCIVNTDLFVL